MTQREKEIEQASVDYQMSKHPMAIGGDAFADMIYKVNINPSFIAGAEWSDENPDERKIAKYLYEKKGYPIDLNGNLPSFEETIKDIEKYNKYKEDAFIDKACEWLKSHSDYLRIHDNGKGVRFDMTRCVIDFRRAMKVE